MSEEQRLEYWEVKNVKETAFGEGKIEGIVVGKIEGEKEGRLKEKYETARALKAENLAIEFIVKITGLTAKEIEAL